MRPLRSRSNAGEGYEVHSIGGEQAQDIPRDVERVATRLASNGELALGGYGQVRGVGRGEVECPPSDAREVQHAGGGTAVDGRTKDLCRAHTRHT